MGLQDIGDQLYCPHEADPLIVVVESSESSGAGCHGGSVGWHFVVVDWGTVVVAAGAAGRADDADHTAAVKHLSAHKYCILKQ